MPLEPGKSRAAFSHNVSEMMKSGHPQKQAVAAAYSERRRSDAARLDAMIAGCAEWDAKRADSFKGLVKKLESEGKTKAYATKIAGKVANEKGMNGSQYK